MKCNRNQGYYVSEDNFKAHHRTRRQRMLTAYLQTLEAEVRVRAVALVQKDAADLGLAV